MNNSLKNSSRAFVFCSVFCVVGGFSNFVCAATATFTYDKLNRLTSATYDGLRIEYTYDSAGNIASVETPYALRVELIGEGTGTVSSTEADIKCGTKCAAVFPQNQVVTLDADVGNASAFQGWSGACSGADSCVVTISALMDVSATFTDLCPADPEKDKDEDGVCGDLDNCALVSNADQSNLDGDMAGDACDDDDDNDGVPDLADAFPLDASESVDSDLDGIGNTSDIDDDNDGVNDLDEIAQGTSPYLSDTDGDGALDGIDELPLDGTETVDTDKDGLGNNADTDDDGDGIHDNQEVQLGLDPLLADTDGDGIDDGNDEYPLDDLESIDTDGDGTGDVADSDDDGDGLSDAEEGQLGTDSLLADTDGDGVNDGVDKFPLDSSRWIDPSLQTLDVNGDGKVDGLSDGAIITRFMLGYPVSDIATDAEMQGATRTRLEMFDLLREVVP